jgi:hypothetical protein
VEDVGFFQGYRVDDDGLDWAETPVTIRRLDLRSGQWMPSLVIVGETTKKNSGEALDSILTSQRRVAILTAMSVDDDVAEKSIISRVTCFPRDGDKPIWSRQFHSKVERLDPPTSAFVPEPAPDSSESSLHPLSWVGERLLVCLEGADGKRDLVCLNGDTGKSEWRLDRIWEFQRGYIGPSVYQYYISRFGIETFSKKGENEDKIHEAREAFEKNFEGNIVAGPLVIPLHLGGQATRFFGPAARIFVAVAKGPSGPYSGQLSDCLVYELNEAGTPIASLPMPRMIDGRYSRVFANGLVWTCHGEAIVRIRFSNENAAFTPGPGSKFCVGEVEWYRQMSSRGRDAWITAGRESDLMALTETYAIRPSDGGYILREREQVYHFPMALIDLRTGLERETTLDVPFRGTVPDPERNYCRQQLQNGDSRWSTTGPYLIAISRVRVEGSRLKVSLDGGEWSMDETDVADYSAILEFPAEPLSSAVAGANAEHR